MATNNKTTRGNPRELRRARQAARRATDALRAIESLPRRRGQQVRWANGVVWERIGDDAWRPTTAPDDSDHWTFPSSHVASFWFTRVSPERGA